MYFYRHKYIFSSHVLYLLNFKSCDAMDGC